MGFSRQEYWSGLPFPPPADPPDQGTEPASVASPALARWQSDSFTTVLPGKPADTTPARMRAHTRAHTHTHTHTHTEEVKPSGNVHCQTLHKGMG